MPGIGCVMPDIARGNGINVLILVCDLLSCMEAGGAVREHLLKTTLFHASWG